MPLKIRCPHCRRVLVADDDVAGETKRCPACGQTFNVPLPATLDSPSLPAAARKCPRCGTEAGPTATHCPRCLADLATGRRPPLKERLRRKGWVFWTGVGVGAAIVALVGLGAYRLYDIYTQTPPPAIEVPSARAAAENQMRALFAADTPGELDAAIRAVHLDEPAVAAAVAAALRESLDAGGSSAMDVARQRAAIDILVRCGDRNSRSRSASVEVLERAGEVPALAESALHARARLGDARTLPELGAAWQSLLRRELLLERIARCGGSTADAGMLLAMERTRTCRAACAAALRVLSADPNILVYESLADGYWDSWEWLGQDDAGLYADALFDLARPGDGATLAFDPRDIRQPRDILARAAERGTPRARAAAGLVLARRGPQYRSRCQAICETLRQILPECAPRDRQRLIWTISRLIGKLFLNEAPAHPWDVTYDQVVDALRWAGAPDAAGNPQEYARPPMATYRVVTTRSRLEPELLAELRGGWARADAAAERWLVAGLGVTAGLREVLSPAQRQPDYAAVANALAIVAEIGDDSLRRILELWSDAPDQPAWVRAAAYCALGALDARQGAWRSGWPAGLDLGNPAELARGEPGWAHLGRVIAAGGPRTIDRLAEIRPATLPVDVYTRLLDESRAALQARDERPGG